MLSPVINKHHDKIEGIQKKVEDDIDEILKSINIDAIIDDPQGVLDSVVEVVRETILSDHMEPAVKAGLEFAKEIEKAKSIKVDDSKDPQKNEAIA